MHPDWSRLQLWQGPSYRQSRPSSLLTYVTSQELRQLWRGVILNLLLSTCIFALLITAGIH